MGYKLSLIVKDITLPSGRVVRIRKLNLFDYVELDLPRLLPVLTAKKDALKPEDMAIYADVMRRIIMRVVVQPPLSDKSDAENSVYALTTEDILFLIEKIFEFSEVEEVRPFGRET